MAWEGLVLGAFLEEPVPTATDLLAPIRRIVMAFGIDARPATDRTDTPVGGRSLRR